MNASTFTARVIASTLSDMHSAITGAIGALKGPLHGGANEQVMRLLRVDPGRRRSVDDEIRARLDRKERIMGFGHRVYKTWDPRAVILKRFSKQLAEETGDPRWYDMSEHDRADGRGREGPLPERRLLLGVDVPLPRHRHRPVHADLRDEPRRRLGCARDRAARGQPPDPAELGVRRAVRAGLRADRAPRRDRRRSCISSSGRSRIESPRPGSKPTRR